VDVAIYITPLHRVPDPLDMSRDQAETRVRDYLKELGVGDVNIHCTINLKAWKARLRKGEEAGGKEEQATEDKSSDSDSDSDSDTESDTESDDSDT
jgi:hypothetical protein